MKLTYFDLRGRGEPIRFTLAAAGVHYEDVRIKGTEWPNLKPEMPWGQLPVLELNDGTVLAQTVTICRYLARQHNLAGSNEIEAAKCDEYVDAFGDIIKEWAHFVWEETDPDQKAEKKIKFLEITAPNFFEKLSAILNKNGGQHLVGSGLTWADIFIGCCIEGLEVTTDPALLQEFPAVASMRAEVINNPSIKAWIDKRPPEDLAEIIKKMSS